MPRYRVFVTRVFRYDIEAPNRDAATEIAAADVSAQFDQGRIITRSSKTTEVSAHLHPSEGGGQPANG
jgi:hypothetical protein